MFLLLFLLLFSTNNLFSAAAADDSEEIRHTIIDLLKQITPKQREALEVANSSVVPKLPLIEGLIASAKACGITEKKDIKEMIENFLPKDHKYFTDTKLRITLTKRRAAAAAAKKAAPALDPEAMLVAAKKADAMAQALMAEEAAAKPRKPKK